MIQRTNLKHRYFLPVLDRCAVDAKADEGTEVVMTTTSATGGFGKGLDIVETRTAYGSDYNVSFDLGPYFRTIEDAEQALPGYLVSTTASVWEALAIYIHYLRAKVKIGDEDEQELELMPFLASMAPGEKMTGKRYHLYNPNFPHRITLYYYDSTSIKVNGTTTTGGLKSVKLRSIGDGIYLGRLDDFGKTYSKDFTVTMTDNLEPTEETNVKNSPVKEEGGAIWDDLSGWTDTRTDVYLWDCRDEGVCLRFFDHFGMVQTIVLDVATRERSTSDTVRRAYGHENRYKDTTYGFVYGDGSRADKEAADVIHAGLESVREELYGDLCDLASSPVVMMYDGTNWQRVRVTAGTITRNEKKHLISADFDVYTCQPNTLR